VTTLVPGEAVGQFVGGTTTLLAATLGTPWEIETTGRIVLLEDINEQPYASDRMLVQLLQAGKLKDAAGLVLGEHVNIRARLADSAFGRNSLTMTQVFERVIEPLGLPTVYGLPLGHGYHIATVPLGVKAHLNASIGALTFLEPALR
jgi:muramoyltetrapeptide carboxypeptidase